KAEANERPIEAFQDLIEDGIIIERDKNYVLNRDVFDIDLKMRIASIRRNNIFPEMTNPERELLEFFNSGPTRNIWVMGRHSFVDALGEDDVAVFHSLLRKGIIVQNEQGFYVLNPRYPR